MKTKILLISVLISLLVAPALSAGQNHTATPDKVMAPGLVPGDLFYPVEKMVERAEVAIAGAPVFGSESLQARAIANNAEERLAEAKKLSERGNNTEKVSRLMDEYRNGIGAATSKFKKSNDTKNSKKFANVTGRHTEVLQGIKKKVPSQAHQGIERALEQSREARRQMGPPPGTPGRPDTGKEKPGNKPKTPREKPGMSGDVRPSGQLTENPLSESIERGPKRPTNNRSGSSERLEKDQKPNSSTRPTEGTKNRTENLTGSVKKNGTGPLKDGGDGLANSSGLPNNTGNIT